MSRAVAPRGWAAALILWLFALPAVAADQPAKAGLEPAALTSKVIGTPYPGPARSIGSAANGCLAGAVALPLSGPGWEMLRPARNRFWGNPALVSFIEDMATKTTPLGTLLVADMAQPRGGHMTYGHGSHQTGVDVDLLYRLVDAPLSEEERTSPAMDSVLTDGQPDPRHWGDTQTALLKLFASDLRVERIFVNPAIKRALCASVGGDRGWLRKLRPWWGHDDHFHVRIKCPAGDSECIAGPPLPPGDGCGHELDWWFSQEATLPKPPTAPRPPARPLMPAACKVILGSTGTKGQ